MSALQGERRRVYPDLDQVFLRGMVVLGTMTAVVAAQAAGARPAGWLTSSVLVVALYAACRPDSTATVLLLGGAGYVWALAPHSLSPFVLLAVAGMVLLHVSALLAAQGPGRMQVDRGQVRRWLARAMLIWLAAAVVWVGVALLEDRPGNRLVYAAGLVLLTAVAILATRLIGPRRPIG